MKKLSKIFIVFALSLGLFACSTNKFDNEAMDLLVEAINKLPDYRSANFELNGSIDDSEMGTKIDMKGSFKLDAGIGYAMKMTSGNLTIEQYLNGNTLYSNTGGIKSKSTLPMIDQLHTMDKSSFKVEKDDLKEIFKEVKYDGEKITILFDNEKFNDEIVPILQQAAEELNPTADMKEMKIELTLTKYKMIEKMNVTLKMDLASGENKLSSTFKYNIKLSSINTVESIEYPTDLDTYTEAIPE